MGTYFKAEMIKENCLYCHKAIGNLFQQYFSSHSADGGCYWKAVCDGALFMVENSAPCRIYSYGSDQDIVFYSLRIITSASSFNYFSSSAQMTETVERAINS